MQGTGPGCYGVFEETERCPGVFAAVMAGARYVHVKLLRRIAPALLLLVLAPVTAEFLLGDFTVRSLPLLLLLGWQ